MRAPPATDLLAAWERGQPETLPRRALLLLAAAFDDVPAEQIVRWSIGTRDAALLQMRERLFGGELASWTSCPACRERVEFQLHCRELLRDVPEPSDRPLRAQWAGYEAEFRLPSSLDLEALTPEASLAENRACMLGRCVAAVRHGPEEIPASALPPELAAKIVTEMAAADPHAEITLDLSCPACLHRWQAMLDVVSYLWSEVHAWASRLLREVHEIALAYGWSETEILALSAVRRQHYLNLIRA